MSTYIKLFETTAQYTEYMGGEPYLPNVSLCKDNIDKPIHYTPLTLIPVAPPSNPVNEGYYTDTLTPIDDSYWYPEEFEGFPIIIDQQNTNFEPYDDNSMIRLWVKKGTTLANDLMSIYNEYGTNNIGTYPDYGNTLFANYGLKFEVGGTYGGLFVRFNEVYNSNSEIEFDIVLTAQESGMDGKIYYEDQSGNKWYLFEWTQG